jgi:hypothetical protein
MLTGTSAENRVSAAHWPAITTLAAPAAKIGPYDYNQGRFGGDETELLDPYQVSAQPVDICSRPRAAHTRTAHFGAF